MQLDQNKPISNDLKEFLDLSPYAAIYINQQAEVVYLNNKGSELIASNCFDSENNTVDFNYIDFIVKNSPPKADLLVRNIKMILAGKKDKYKFEYFSDKDIYFEVKISKFKAGVLILYENISERKVNKKMINYIGYHDQLTDIYNRTYIEKELKKYDQVKHLPLAVVMIDINGLTLVNESYSYQKGDKILIKVAAKLKTFLRENDLLGRWSGDEFIILMPESSEEQISALRKSVDSFCDSTAEDEIPISLGFGSAVKKEMDSNLYQVINQADRKMNQDKLTKSRSSKNKFVRNLINTLGAKSNETKEHALRMTSLAFNLGDKLNLSHEKLNKLNLLATLHDIGKVTISEKILNKPGKLTEEEWKIIKSHPVKGAKIANSTDEFSSIAEYIIHHHERWDGSGYPDALAEKEIPLLSRVITLVDSYDVMTNERPYKKAMSKKEAVKEIRRCAGSQFDPELAVEFIKLLEEGEG